MWTKQWLEAAVGCVLVKGAIAAWCVLAFAMDPIVHVTATYAFMACSIGYILVLIHVNANSNPLKTSQYDTAWYCMLLLTFLFGVLYTSIYWTDPGNAWIPEQMCLMLFTDRKSVV